MRQNVLIAGVVLSAGLCVPTVGSLGLLSPSCASAQNTPPAPAAASSVAGVFDRVRSHDFHPLDGKDFTIDRELKRHGIRHRGDPDGRVLLLAVRDLVRAGEAGVPAMIDALRDENPHVRLVAAQALGVLKADAAAPALLAALTDDAAGVVRSQAAVSLGQLALSELLPALRERLAADPSKDVQHQIEVAIDRTEKGKPVTPQHAMAYRALDESTFDRLVVGQPAPAFTLPDTEGAPWALADQKGQWTVLVWIFADWCPVCHGEFRELIEMRERFAQAGVRVATVEAHDAYRSRVIVGKELEPKYWFANRPFKEDYTQNIWWPHLVDHAGAVGATYGVEPQAYAVHAEYVNRPATIIIDPQGVARFAYYGTFWGDRPSVEQTLEMIEQERFEFENPRRLGAPRPPANQERRRGG